MKLDLRPRKLLVKLGTAAAEPEKIDSVKQWFQVSRESLLSQTSHIHPSRPPCPIIGHRSASITTVRL